MTEHVTPEEYAATLGRLRDLAVSRHTHALALPTIASPNHLQHGIDTLPTSLPSHGWGFGKTSEFLLQQITDVLAPGHNGTRYFGFVTGGVTPIASESPRHGTKTASAKADACSVHLSSLIQLLPTS